MINIILNSCKIIGKTVFLLVFIISMQGLNAQDFFPIQYYSPKQYQAENQNWAISQAKNKFIYVANSKGLLEFNGAEWTLYPSPNETIIRSVDVVNNKIYTGSYMEFGFWTKTSFGNLKYTSLSAQIKNKLLDDEQIWNITHLDNYILFQSLNRIYIYNTQIEQFNIIKSDVSILNLFKVNDTIYFQDKTKGLMLLESGAAKLVSNASLFLENTIIGVYKVNNKLLVITQNNGAFTIENGTVKAVSPNLNKTLSKYSVYSCKQLIDGSFVLGTIANGILKMSLTEGITQKVNQKKGLGNNTVLSVFQDIDRNIWLGLDHGISCINVGSPFKIFNDNEGVLGTVYNTVKFQGNLYIGTNQGLFYKSESDERFKRINSIKGQVWQLKIIDNQLFCGHNSGTYLIERNKANQIASVEGTWDIKPIENHPNLLLQGNYNGLNILEKKNGAWRFRNKIEGFNNSSRFFEFSKTTEILVNHEYKGVFKIEIDSDFRKVLSVSKDKNLSKGLFSSLAVYNKHMYYANKDGVFKKPINSNAAFQKDTFLSNLIEEQGFSSGKLVVDSKTNKLWIVTKKGLNYITPGNLSAEPNVSFVPLPSALRDGVSGFESIFNSAPNTYIFGNSTGYISLNLSKIASKNHEVIINSIQGSPIGDSSHLIDLNTKGEFPNKENNIGMTFSVVEYDKFLEAEYSHQLEGLYDSWSAWSKTPSILYKNLPYGDYNFKLKARVGGQELQSMASYAFIIAKPWYLTNLMIVLYVLLAILLVGLIHYFYKLYYKRQKEKLIKKSNRELELKDLETKQQLMFMNNNNLRQEIENKNRELAISTMSLIKKNEFLNTIKSELNAKVKDASLKSVIRIIDNNINNKDDWNLFEEAFNNADKDFLKKIKAKHAALTSNDLRLCAYLRLNLSSKEIAPLLNISPRSVEVKRYRLRKKMELEHDVNLTDYILAV